MSPEAHEGYVAPIPRVPRTLWEHGHIGGDADFPPDISTGTMMTVLHIPDNWNGFDEFFLKLLGGTTEATTIDVTINAGTCDELINTHTQTVNDIAINFVLNEWECPDLMTLFATVIALMLPDDNIVVQVSCDSVNPQLGVGVVIEES